MEIIGTPISPGIAIGEALIYSKDLVIPKYSISDLQINFEIERFHDALKRAKKEFIKLKAKIIDEMGEEEGKFLDSHILMTEDQTLIKEVIQKINKEKKNVEWIIFQVIDSIASKFSKMTNEYFRDRGVDILDIGRKVLEILLSKKNMSLADIDRDVVIISSDLSVSDTASMNKNHILAFVTEYGGKTSHASILSRSLGIPAVFGIKGITHQINSGDTVIIDGNIGKIIINPDENILIKYNKIKSDFIKKENDNLLLKDLPSETLDGKTIQLNANMEIPEQEIDLLIAHGAEGIGLYRSEFLYLATKSKILPSEDQQFSAYKFILEKFPTKKVTIRTLDLGGDKILHDITEKELNPNLGWRAVRFCLARPDIFKTQLRALYRASLYGNLQIMFPMISGIEELLDCKKIVKEVKNELKAKHIKFNDKTPLGIMIETPSAAMTSDILAAHADFFSIGTNDLIQYTMACDRGNSKVAYLYEPLHPSILRLIKLVIDNAHKQNIKVSLCGEMGADIENAIILIGMDIDELSMGPMSILELKKLIRNIKYEDAKKIANHILKMDNYKDILKYVSNWIRTNLNYIYT